LRPYLNKERVLEKLDVRAYFASQISGLRGSGDELRGRCPFHADKDPSFSVNVRTRLWKCHAACGEGDVFDFVQQKEGVDFKEALQILDKEGGTVEDNSQSRLIMRSYRWDDAEGNTAYHLRWSGSGSKFSWAQDAEGRAAGQGQCKTTLYELKSVTSAANVVIVEGEHDADTLNEFFDQLELSGFRATCTPNGAADVKEEYFELLTDKQTIWISGDNDSAGETYIKKCQTVLQGKAKNVRLLPVPTGVKDWADWRDAGGWAVAFQTLLNEAIPGTPWRCSLDLLKEPAPETEWLVKNLIPQGGVVLLSGREGSMKSWLTMFVASLVAEGKSWGSRTSKLAKVLYLDGEMPADLFRRTLQAYGGSEYLSIWRWQDPSFPSSLNDPLLREASRQHQLIVVDTLRRFMGRLKENSADDMAEITQGLRELTRHGATVIALHHSLKDETKAGYRGSTELGAGVDVVLSLIKTEQEGLISLTLTSQKTRYSQDASMKLRAKRAENPPQFEEMGSIEEECEDSQEYLLDRLRDVIATLWLDLKRNPNQSEIVDFARENEIGGRTKILGLLDLGEGIHWTTEKIDGRTKAYDVFSCSVV
jgi:hypothetical protein